MLLYYYSIVLLFIPGFVNAVKPIWKTPISEPNPTPDAPLAKEHLNLAKRAQPNYYTRPEQVSIPDYRPPKQRIPPPPQRPLPQPNQFIPFQSTPNNGGGHFRPFAWIGPQPRPGSPQTSYYEQVPNKGQSFPNGLPPLPPNWQQYPVQMIWIPDNTEHQNTYLQQQPSSPYGGNVYGAPVPPAYGLYGPSPSPITKAPMKPASNPETYTGTIVHSPSANPTTEMVSTEYTVQNSYGGEQTTTISVSVSTDSTLSGTESTVTSDTSPTSSRTVNPTIRPGPQEPSGGYETGHEDNTRTSLPFDADGSREITSKIPPFDMTKNPYETDAGKTVPPVYLGPDEETTETEDISKPKSPENSADKYNQPPQAEEDEMMKNYFPRPVSSQGYQPPGHQPEDFSSHINVNFKKPKGCNTPFCKGVDTERISLYKPDRNSEGSGPTLVISNAAKDDASRAGYKPAPPLINQYIPPPPPPNPEDYATPYTVPPEYQPFPPLKEYTPAVPGAYQQTNPPPRSFIPAQNFQSTSVVPPSEHYFESTPSSVAPTAQTISTRFTTTIKAETSDIPKSSTPTEDKPEYVPPAIAHMTASTPSGKNPPTYKPINPESSTPSALTTSEGVYSTSAETNTPATVTRQPEFPVKPSVRSRVVTTSETEAPTSGTTKNENLEHGTTQGVAVSTPTVSAPSSFTSTERLSPSFGTTEVSTERSTAFSQPSTSPPGASTVSSTSETTTSAAWIYTTTITSPEGHVTEVTAKIPPSFPRNNPYSPPEGLPRVPNRLIGKPRILCKEDGISFEVKTIHPLNGEVFANDRKRVPGCQKTFTDDEHPKVFLPFDTCGVKNVGDQIDSREQYHMQVVLVIDHGNGTNTLQSFMAQCVHQKVNYNKQTLPKRIEEALEELRLVPSKLEQKASMPTVQMQIVVDEGHHKLGAEVSAADIGMPLALKWSLQPESDAYGMHIRNCKVVDAVGKLDHTLIDEQGCSADLQIIDHPHYDTYHDTASAHMWAFKVPDMASLQIKCDILICSNIKSSVTNTTSCEDIPSPPFCADVVTSPPNSILSDASSFAKSRRASMTESSALTSTQSVRTAICLSKTCLPEFADDIRVCINTQLATASTGLSVAFLLFAISFQVIARTKRR